VTTKKIMRQHEILQLAIYKRDQAARFRRLMRARSSAEARKSLEDHVAVLEREDQLEAEGAAMGQAADSLGDDRA